MKNSSNEHHGPVIDVIDDYSVINCLKCRFKHVYPIPTDEELKELYSKTYFTSEKPDYFKDAEEDLKWLTLTYENHFKSLRKHTKGNRLLDIGSGPGHFIKCGQDMGWNVLGIEPSPHAAEYSSKLGKFDVVTMKHVIEHVSDPIRLINDVKSILNPNGLIFIISPNDYNPLQEILRQNLDFKPWWVVPLQHINYFDFKSIENLLETLNFRVIDSTASYPMELFLLSGENYIGNRVVGRECHQKRKNLEINLYEHNPDLLNSLYKSLAQNNIGRDFVIIGETKD